MGMVAAICLCVHPAGAVSIEDAVQAALKNSPEMALATAGVILAESRLDMARSGYMPDIGMSASALQGDNPVDAFGTKLLQSRTTANDMQVDQLLDPRASRNVQGRLSLNVPIHTPQLSNIIESARAACDSARENLRATRQDISAKAIQAYYDVLLTQSNLAAIQARITEAEGELEEASRLKNQGLVLGSDYHLARTMLGQLKQELIHTRARVKIARGALNIRMGRDADSNIELSGGLETTQLPDADDALQRAAGDRPDVRAARSDESAAVNDLQTESKSHLPVVRGFGDVEEDAYSLDRQSNNYRIGIRLTVPIFDPADRAREAMHRAARDRSRAWTDVVEDAADVDILGRFHEYQAVRESVPVARQTLEDAKEALRMFRQLYRNGRQSIADVLKGEFSLYQSQAGLNSTLRDVRVGYAELLRAAGRLDTVPDSLK